MDIQYTTPLSSLAAKCSVIFVTAWTALMLVACGSAGPTQSSDETPVAEGDLKAVTMTEGTVLEPAGLRVVPAGAPCGPALGACDADTYCRFPDGAACGDGDVAGICEARPRGCRRDCPGVCGCDGTRYCNTCVAEAQGFSVRHKGSCEEAPDVSP